MPPSDEGLGPWRLRLDGRIVLFLFAVSTGYSAWNFSVGPWARLTAFVAQSPGARILDEAIGEGFSRQELVSIHEALGPTGVDVYRTAAWGDVGFFTLQAFFLAALAHWLLQGLDRPRLRLLAALPLVFGCVDAAEG